MILRPAALLPAIATLTFVGAVFAADPVNIEIMSVDEEPGRMTLSVSAVDENGKPFPGLDPSSFNAWINDSSLIVKELRTETDRQPASVLLLVDASGSMDGEPIEQAKIAINEFIGVLEPNDEVAVMTFSSGVNLVQDFTSDRAALDAAITGITLTNDTALYDGVTAAASRMADLPANRKMIVLLSDGLANINQGARDASIQSARESGVSFIAVSLGANTDLQYLEELTSASGGSLIEAATPAELRQAYTSLAFAIRSQYTLVMEVPRSVDRTIAGTLKVHVIHRADNAFAERTLSPLEGAVPPPFSMSLAGINAGDKHNGVVELTPSVQEGIEVAKVEYFLDDEVIHTSSGIDNFTLAPRCWKTALTSSRSSPLMSKAAREKSRCHSWCRSWSCPPAAPACRLSRSSPFFWCSAADSLSSSSAASAGFNSQPQPTAGSMSGLPFAWPRAVRRPKTGLMMTQPTPCLAPSRRKHPEMNPSRGGSSSWTRPLYAAANLRRFANST